MNSLRAMVFFLFFAAGIFLFNHPPVCADDVDPPQVKENYQIVAGKWQRTDGNYLIKVSDVQKDGQATVAYFNPRPIHVSQAAISTQKEMIRLFVKFQDKGYEGSTYTLYYYAKEDALVGFYYQAPMDRTFEVIFLRKN